MNYRFAKVNPFDLQAIEAEIDLLIDLAGDDPSDYTIEQVTKLIKAAKALGTKRKW